MTHWVFLSKPVYDISSSLPKNCITGQNKPQGCCAPSCPNTGIPQKKQLLVNWEALGLGSLEGLQPEDPGGLGRGGPERSDPPPAWQEARGESQRAASPPVARTRWELEVLGQGETWERGWNNQNLFPFNFGGVAFVHPLCYLSPRRWSGQPSGGPRGGWRRRWGRGSSPPARIPRGLQWS